MRSGTGKMGWCITGHHRDCRIRFMFNHEWRVCNCDCHPPNSETPGGDEAA